MPLSTLLSIASTLGLCLCLTWIFHGLNASILDPQKNCLEIFLYKNCSVLRNKNHEHILKEIILHGFSVVLLMFLCVLKHKFYLNERINMYVNGFAHTREAKRLIKVLTYNDVRIVCIP